MKIFLTVMLSMLIVVQASAFNSHILNNNEYKNKYTLESFATGIDIPWGIAQLPSGELLVTEREGLLYKVDSMGKLRKVSGLPAITSNGQGGLLDIALHPNFSENAWIYLTLASKQGAGSGSNTALIRAKLDQESWQLTNIQTLYKGQENTSNGRHYGSRIAFDNKGYVYFSIGDRGQRDVNPQNLKRDGGKIYRLHDDGTIPQDNPFSQTASVKSAVFSYGHRNPQGLVFDQGNNVLWAHEHGPKGGDELNAIQAGINYGWPIVSHGVNYSGSRFTKLTEKKGMESPKLYWTPSIAPSGMTLVESKKFPELQGKLLLGSLKFGYIVVVETDKSKVIGQYQLLDNLGRVRSLLSSSTGDIYIGIDGQGIKKLKQK